MGEKEKKKNFRKLYQCLVQHNPQKLNYAHIISTYCISLSSITDFFYNTGDAERKVKHQRNRMHTH